MISAAHTLTKSSRTVHTKLENASTADERDFNLVYDAILGCESARNNAWPELRRRFQSGLIRSARRALSSSPGRAEDCVDEFWQHLVAHTKLSAFLRHKPGTRSLTSYLLRAVSNFAKKEFLALSGKTPGSADHESGSILATVPAQDVPTTYLPQLVAAMLSGYHHLSTVCFKLRFAGLVPLTEADLAFIRYRSGWTHQRIHSMLRHQPHNTSHMLAHVVRITRANFDKRVQYTKAYLKTQLRHSGYHPEDTL